MLNYNDLNLEFIQKKEPCANKCSMSTSIAETLTFGFGNLDLNGFFENECFICSNKYHDFIENRTTEITVIDLDIF